jgi:hypothetical protein
MKTRTILAALASLVIAAMVCLAAQNEIMGTWKLNQAKSKISPQ